MEVSGVICGATKINWLLINLLDKLIQFMLKAFTL